MSDEKMNRILDQAKAMYGAEISHKYNLGNSTNIIFDISIAGQPAILRISEHSKQKEAHVRFELAWMDDLARHITQLGGTKRSSTAWAN